MPILSLLEQNLFYANWEILYKKAKKKSAIFCAFAINYVVNVSHETRFLVSIHHHCFTFLGIKKENVVPCPTMLLTEIFPSCASTMFFAIASPNPVPDLPLVLALSAL